MHINKFLNCLFCSFIILFVSCDKNKDHDNENNYNLDRTILIYMNAENSLSSYTTPNIDDMILAMSESTHGLNLLVYEDKDSISHLWQIGKDNKGNTAKLLKNTYFGKNASDSEWMTTLINESFALYPSKETGLVLWSHGTGWLPSFGYRTSANAAFINEIFSDKEQESEYTSGYPVTMSFGDDKGVNMDIWELRKALEDTGIIFDFIAFDACYMASVEVAYELRNVTKGIMASVTEIMGDGYPYYNIVEVWLRREFTLSDMCDAYYNYYNTRLTYNYGSISYTLTSELENIADLYTEILKENLFLDQTYSDSIQEYGRYRNRFNNIFYDIQDVVKYKSPSKYNKFSTAMNKAIPYKNSTPSFIELPINLDIYSGLSVFLPEFNDNLKYHDGYTNLEWYKRVFPVSK